MATSLKKLAAGIAAAAIAVSGFALGLGTANAANDAKGTITLTNNNGDAESHTYTAYLVAPYKDGYKPSSNPDYVDIDTFGYGTVAQADAVAEALVDAGFTTANKDTVSEDLKKLTTSSEKAPWGYKAGSSTKEAAERKFADALAASSKFTDNVAPVTFPASSADGRTSIDVTPGLYLVLDNLKTDESVKPASTKSVPMLVPSKIGTYEGLMPAKGDPILVHGDITLKNTTVPVTKQVVDTDGTTPYRTPSYNIGNTVTFQLTTTIPEYAGYDKDSGYDKDTNPPSETARVLKLTDTFQPNANNDNKIPFSNAQVAKDAVTIATDKGKITLTPGKDYDFEATTTGAIIDFGKLVNHVSDTTWETGNVITVVLTATLNKDAFVTDTANASAEPKTGCDSNGNCNGVEVEFTNHYKNETSKVKGPKVNVYSFKFNVKKRDKENPSVFLPNAQFVISDGPNSYLTYDADNGWSHVPDQPNRIDTTASSDAATPGVFVTDADGNISFKGLKAGTYTVTEIAAPKGYYQNALPSFKVTIGATYKNDTTNTVQLNKHKTNSSEPSESGDDWLTELTYEYTTDPNRLVKETDIKSTVTVDNVTSITQLPKTGAAGIALFTVFGAAVLGAAGFFGLRARKAAKQLAQQQ